MKIKMRLVKKEVNQRGQVTIFIIIAILIIAGVILYFLLKSPVSKEISIQEIAPIENAIYECAKQSLEDGVFLIGIQGGYFEFTKDHFISENSEIGYAYDKGKNTLATISEIENQINKYVELAVPICFELNNFSEYNIEKKETKAKTSVRKDKVNIEIEFPVIITKGNSTSILNKKISEEVLVNLGDMHFIAQKIINEKLNFNYIDLTYLSELDYDLEILPQENNIFIYSIKDKNFQLEDIPYTFNFAVRK